MKSLPTGTNRRNREQGEWSVQNFADANEPAGSVFVDRAIGHAMFIDAEPDQKHCLNRGGVKSDEIERGNSMSEQFQDGGGRSQSGSSKMNRQQCAMQKPRGNRRCSDEHAGVSREQSSKNCRTKNENPGGEAQELIKTCRGKSDARAIRARSTPEPRTRQMLSESTRPSTWRSDV